MRSSKDRSGLALAVAALCLLVSPVGAEAQSDDNYTRYGDWRDRVYINAGAFFVGHDTFALLRPTGTDIPGVNVERDTAVPADTSDFRFEGYLRLGRRHRLHLGYVRMNRDSVNRLTGSIEWDGETFPVDAQVATKWDTRIYDFRYRFSVIKRERVDVGLSLGLFFMKVEAGIGLGADVGAVEADTAEEAPLPMLGASVEWEFAENWMLRARGRYLGLSIKDTLDGGWGEAGAAVEWYPIESFRQLGIGAGYNYSDIDVKLEFGEIIRRDFEYQYKFRGPVVYAVLSF